MIAALRRGVSGSKSERSPSASANSLDPVPTKLFFEHVKASLVKCFMGVKMMCRMHEDEPNAAVTTSAWWEFLAVYNRNLVFFFVVLVMYNLVDA